MKKLSLLRKNGSGNKTQKPINQNEGLKKDLWNLAQITGNLLILGGILYLIVWSYPVVSANLFYYYHNLRGYRYQVSADPQPSKNNDFTNFLEKPKEPLKIVPSSTEFGIVIEKINVNAPIVPEVDPTNADEYSTALNQGVAHALGTVFPGQVGNSFLFSHSTFNVFEISKYKAIFTLLNKLETGDRVVTFYKGERFDYEVAEVKVVPPTDVTSLIAKYDTPVLTLQTCDPPGTDLNRLIVIAHLIK